MPPERDRDDAIMLTTDSATVRAWAHEHDAVPVRHREEDRLALRVGGASDDRYERVSWEVFGNGLSKKEYVVRYHGAESETPIEVVDRERAIQESNVERSDLEERLDDGQTVTSETAEGSERASTSTDNGATGDRGGTDEWGRSGSDRSGIGHTSGDRETGDQSSTATSDVEESRATTTGEAVGTQTSGDEHAQPRVTKGDIGKDVVDPTGETLGMVRVVDEAEQTVYVASNPSITDRIKAALEVGGADAEDVPIGRDRIDSIGRDSITLNDADDLEALYEARPAS